MRSNRQQLQHDKVVAFSNVPGPLLAVASLADGLRHGDLVVDAMETRIWLLRKSRANVNEKNAHGRRNQIMYAAVASLPRDSKSM